jgi:hypothetical protein
LTGQVSESSEPRRTRAPNSKLRAVRLAVLLGSPTGRGRRQPPAARLAFHVVLHQHAARAERRRRHTIIRSGANPPKVRPAERQLPGSAECALPPSSSSRFSSHFISTPRRPATGRPPAVEDDDVGRQAWWWQWYTRHASSAKSSSCKTSCKDCVPKLGNHQTMSCYDYEHKQPNTRPGREHGARGQRSGWGRQAYGLRTVKLGRCRVSLLVTFYCSVQA